MSILKSLLFLCLLSIVGIAQADLVSTPWEITGSYGDGNMINVSHSAGTQFYRGAIGYFPSLLTWGNFSIGGEISGAYLQSSGLSSYSVCSTCNYLGIVSAAPVVRWYFGDRFIRPYMEAGSGPSYLTHRQYVDQRLGIRYAFEDFVGGGIMFQTIFPVVIGARFYHYSNASMSTHNDGVTVPVVFYGGVRF